MNNSRYHYTECGLDSIYLINGYNFIDTPRGRAVSINNVDGLHRAIGLMLVNSKRDLKGQELRFLRNEMLLSQSELGNLLGLDEHMIDDWESEKKKIAKPPELVIRLLYKEHTEVLEGIRVALQDTADIKKKQSDRECFKDTEKGWEESAA